MILRSERVLSSLGIPHCFTLRDPSCPGFNNVAFLFGPTEDVLACRAAALHEIGQDPAHLVLASQCHGTRIHRVTAEHRGCGALTDESRLSDADGLVTDVHGLPIGVQVADCCCLLMADRNGQAVGAFHAGWRGTYHGMALKAVTCFDKEFGIPAKNLLIWIGPAISSAHYEVDEALWETFKNEWREECLLTNPPRIDLPRLNRKQLLDAGVPSEQIEDCEVCTFESEECFSHRRGDLQPGRMMGVIAR